MAEGQSGRGGAIGMAIVYFVLAALALGIAGIGIDYMTADEFTQNSMFYRFAKGDRISKGQAAPMLIGFGAVLSLSLIAAGVLRLRQSPDSEGA